MKFLTGMHLFFFLICCSLLSKHGSKKWAKQQRIQRRTRDSTEICCFMGHQAQEKPCLQKWAALIRLFDADNSQSNLETRLILAMFYFARALPSTLVWTMVLWRAETLYPWEKRVSQPCIKCLTGHRHHGEGEKMLCFNAFFHNYP